MTPFEQAWAVLKQSLPPFSEMQATSAPPQPPNPMGLASSTGRLSDLSEEEIQEGMMQVPPLPPKASADPVTTGLNLYHPRPSLSMGDLRTDEQILALLRLGNTGGMPPNLPPKGPTPIAGADGEENPNPYKNYIKRHFDMHPLG